MKRANEDSFRDTPSIWEYLVEDYLEISCLLDKDVRVLLLSELAKLRPNDEHIQVHSNFSIGRYLVVMTDGHLLKEMWLFDSKRKTLKKYRLQEPHSNGEETK